MYMYIILQEAVKVNKTYVVIPGVLQIALLPTTPGRVMLL